jgi:hypothetical protein
VAPLSSGLDDSVEPDFEIHALAELLAIVDRLERPA